MEQNNLANNRDTNDSRAKMEKWGKVKNKKLLILSYVQPHDGNYTYDHRYPQRKFKFSSYPSNYFNNLIKKN